MVRGQLARRPCLAEGHLAPGEIEEGRVMHGPTLTHPSTWSTPMRKLLSACRRLDDHWLGDVLGVVFLFGLIPFVLFVGTFFDGGR